MASLDKIEEYLKKAEAEAVEATTAGNDKVKRALCAQLASMWIAMATLEERVTESARQESRQRRNSERLTRVEAQLGIMAPPESPRLPGWLSDGDTAPDDDVPVSGF